MVLDYIEKVDIGYIYNFIGCNEYRLRGVIRAAWNLPSQAGVNPKMGITRSHMRFPLRMR